MKGNNNSKNNHSNRQKRPPEVFCEKGVCKNFANFIGKQAPVVESLFNKVAGL